MSERELSILVIDDDPEFRKAVRLRLLRRNHQVHEAADAAQALACLDLHNLTLAFLDLAMPGMDGMTLLARLREEHPALSVIILTGHGSIDTAVEAMKLGAVDYLIKPCTPVDLDLVIERTVARARLDWENRTLRQALDSLGRKTTVLLGESAAIRNVRDRVRRVGSTDANVLIQGESGTGKELVARMIHETSPRSDRPLVAVNMAAIPEALLEAELFGHVRGAFTGATDARTGLFELAGAGTLFLDEIGDLPLGLQAKLLRVIEDGTFRPVGSNQISSSRARIVSATNQDLRTMAAEGRFREDLFYRLEVFSIVAPPLREYPEDIPILARARLAELSRGAGRTLRLAAPALERLQSYPWPGNVRELYNVLEQAAIVAQDEELREEHLPQRLLQAAAHQAGALAGSFAGDGESTLADVEQRVIDAALAESSGNRTEAARRLGISVRTLQRRLKEREGI